ncbi:hypothetical protein ACYX7E_04480 [Luteimonas sp. RIT-PG2_3]
MSVNASREYTPPRLQGAIAMALISGALLAACSPAPAPSQEAAQQATADTPAPMQGAVTPAEAPAPGATTVTPAAGETVGGDGSQIQLDALTGSDVSDAKLSGELACSFSTGDGSPLLHATGVVSSSEAAQGVVKVSGYVEPIRAPGGFNGISNGATFTGQGKTILIALTGPAVGGGESPPRPATLTYQRADGASRVFDGRWQCGP